MKESTKTAVVLFNLGGPDAAESIKPFLFNFFRDRNIIDLPYPLRWLIAKMISIRRSEGEAGEAYGLLGGGSPLLENTWAQADALEKELNKDGAYKVFVCMRYWHPMAGEVAESVKAWGPDRIVLLPLYPQFSTTTTRSSFQSWKKAVSDIGLDMPTSTVCCYPFDSGFVNASAALVTDSYKTAKAAAAEKNLPPPRVLFSAHGLPEKVIRAGDPYQWQCEETARKIAEATDIPDLDWSICYQSRVGPLKWIGPSTEEALEQAAKDKVPVLIYPHAFVSEHVETLVEIEIEYRHMAEELGVPHFTRVPTVSTHPVFIEGLANIVRQQRDIEGPCAPGGEKLCPPQFGKAGCLQGECATNTGRERKAA